MFNWGGKEQATAGRSDGHGSSGRDNQLRLAQHRARCSICKHPECEEIEQEFLDWMNPRQIAEEWELPTYRAIYRHAHAVGLFERRRENRLAALDAIIQRVHEVPVTASAVVAAIRLSLELEGEPTGAGRQSRAPKFLLSLEGLPRTNAVTGVAPRGECTLQSGSMDDGVVGSGTLQCAPKHGDAAGMGNSPGRPPAAEVPCNEPGGEGHKLKPVPPERRDFAPTSGGEASPDLAKAPTDAAPEGARPAPAEPDPRIVLGEDGRVAGLPWPWPKQKITFVRFARRWRGP